MALKMVDIVICFKSGAQVKIEVASISSLFRNIASTVSANPSAPTHLHCESDVMLNISEIAFIAPAGSVVRE